MPPKPTTSSAARHRPPSVEYLVVDGAYVVTVAVRGASVSLVYSPVGGFTISESTTIPQQRKWVLKVLSMLSAEFGSAAKGVLYGPGVRKKRIKPSQEECLASLATVGERMTDLLRARVTNRQW